MEWWKQGFDAGYLRLYASVLTPKRTAQEAHFVARALHLPRGARLLDVACGHGRHALLLARRGYRITGLDQSQYFLRLARREAKRQKLSAHFVRGDMRRMPFREAFDGAINLFTSFGYFTTLAGEERAARSIAAALVSGGVFLLDVVNREHKMRLIKHGGARRPSGMWVKKTETPLPDGARLSVAESFDPRTDRWQATQWWRKGKRAFVQKTRVRLFRARELERILRGAGFRIIRRWGDFKGKRFDHRNSRRLIILAKKI